MTVRSKELIVLDIPDEYKYMDEEFRVSTHVSDQEDNEVDKKSEKKKHYRKVESTINE